MLDAVDLLICLMTLSGKDYHRDNQINIEFEEEEETDETEETNQENEQSKGEEQWQICTIENYKIY